MQQLLAYEFYGNTVMKYLLFLLFLAASWVVIRILGRIFFKHSTRFATTTKTTADDLLAKSLKRYLLPAAYFAAFYLNTKLLVLGKNLTDIINMAVLAFITIMAALFLSSLVVLLFNKYWESKRGDANNELAVKTISGLLKVIVWSVAGILFLDNVGVKINTLIAGVGIGGIAIAFAAQSILGDIFCFVTIFFDRPFEIGDYIEAGEQMGTVEYIGLKTTRLRALSGEQLIFSNKDLTNSRIRNYKTMQQRRVLFKLGVTYDTPQEKLREIPALMKGIVESVADTTFGRCHFTAFGDSSLSFETAYYILSKDYDMYMDIHQEVNLRISACFADNGISFAFPTQTVHLAGQALQ